MSAIFKDEAEFLRYKKELEDSGILELLENKHKEFEGADYKKGIFWEGKGGAVIPKDKQPGWIIPKHLKKNWKLLLGKSQEKLPQLLKKLGRIDFFMHDSEHSYECMWFEFNEAFSSMVKGGILMSDDIYFNNSFYDFAKKQNKNIIKGGAGIGIIIK